MSDRKSDDDRSGRPSVWSNYVLKGIHPDKLVLSSRERQMLDAFTTYLKDEGWSVRKFPVPDYVVGEFVPDAVATRDHGRMFVEVKSVEAPVLNRTIEMLRSLPSLPSSTEVAIVLPEGSANQDLLDDLQSQPWIRVYEVDPFGGVVHKSA